MQAENGHVFQEVSGWMDGWMDDGLINICLKGTNTQYGGHTDQSLSN